MLHSMIQDREKIEKVVRRCTDRLGFITEEQVNSMIERLTKMQDRKAVVDLLALSIDEFFGKEEQRTNFEASMQDVLELSDGIYRNVDEIIAQVQWNKSHNYIPREYVNRRESYFNKSYIKNSM